MLVNDELQRKGHTVAEDSSMSKICYELRTARHAQHGHSVVLWPMPRFELARVALVFTLLAA